jgi:hypothetical protein
VKVDTLKIDLRSLNPELTLDGLIYAILWA